jgi:kynureninase
MAAIRHTPGRFRIVTDALNFPSDRYILYSAAAMSGCQVTTVPSTDGLTVSLDDLDGAIDESTALVMLTHTAFKSGFTYDMKEVTAMAHRRGALALWDVSHSVGAMPLGFNETDVDLGVGCAYKYLNGGPGAPAFLFVREELQNRLINPLSGWFSHEEQFTFSPDYRPASDIRRFLTGTPPVISLALIEPGVDLLLEAGMDRIRARSVRQSEYFIALWESQLASMGFTLKTPRAADMRGSHVTLGHTEGYRIDQALIRDMKVIPDFRTPDNLRFGITPLYTTFRELHAAIQALAHVVSSGIHLHYPNQPEGVT